ncbi:Rne/Rng family ribonuclease [Nocardioides soli]|uniref:Ribonuclease E n=1 Tax=Nocardioides soli TaxID=1036020 RepID=A0A7W4Z3B7_9ACTN|nr:Rne/Rng family ribonuclease [Nocardioides soli]MBB3043535.1 ribonuclease E [Nocardioides soli]
MADDLQAGTAEPTTAPAETGAPPDEKPAKKTTAKKAAAKTAAKKTAAKKTTAKKAATKKATAKKTAAAAEPGADEQLDLGVDEAATPAKKAPAKKAAAKKTAAKRTTAKKAATSKTADAPVETAVAEPAEGPDGDPAAPEQPAVTGAAVLFQAPETTKKAPARRTRKAAASADETPAEGTEPPAAPSDGSADEGTAEEQPQQKAAKKTTKKTAQKTTQKTAQKAAKKTSRKAPAEDAPSGEEPPVDGVAEATVEADDAVADVAVDEAVDADETEGADVEADGAEGVEGEEQSGEGGGAGRRRRRRGGRRRRKSGDSAADGDDGESGETDSDDAGDSAGEEGQGESSSSRRRRRRRRAGEEGGDAADDPENTVTRVRSKRSVEDEITAVTGSTRLEAKKQRRREGREAGRRRAPIVSEAEFLARRESVDRVMVIRQRADLTQIGVLEDRVLVEHYVARESQTSLIGNVYLGRVQNVLPSMEAAFIDIGKGRNAVLYAGEVNWSALGHKEGQPRKIESVLSSGQTVLVQVTKDPIGHKGARLTSQISLAGRFLVYVPDGTTSGISRKLPDTERNRLKTLLKEIVPDSAGVIVRTAAEGASEDELTRDVERLKARWEDIEGKAKGSAPQLLYGEPDLTLKVVRDLFTEDFSKLVIQGDEAWETVQGYVAHVAADLEERLVRYDPGPDGQGGKADVFAEYRIDEQISKGLDRKVWLPSGGSLIIDRTEAMTVVDVNTGKFTGSGGNLEETVTKNNLEAAEEVVRQLRLRDIGGIIVVDFIDMVLESNRDLVLRRLVECLGRDRTRHQVAEVTSLGLVQMTRKRIGTGLLEAFGETCEHCQGRGVVVHDAPVEAKRSEEEPRRGGRRGRGRGRGQDQDSGGSGSAGAPKPPSPKDVAAMARPDAEPVVDVDEQVEPVAVEPVAVEPVAEAVPETAPEPAPQPEQPKVTTRTRGRRSASRPAAAPEPVEEKAAEEVTAGEPPVAESAAPEPVAPEPVAPEPVVEQPEAAPEPPKVVTRTRGRRASRPAGPPEGADESLPSTPASVGSVGAPPVDGTVEPGTAEFEPAAPAAEEPPHVEHVPIKKKGSRKR